MIDVSKDLHPLGINNFRIYDFIFDRARVIGGELSDCVTGMNSGVNEGMFMR